MARFTALIAAVLLTAAVYAPLRSAPFVYEDGHAFQGVVTWAVPSRALAVTSMRLTPDPGPAHLVNVGLHLTNGLLVWAVASTLAGGVPAVIAAALFLLHPLNAEAVAYVNGRTDLLLTLGALLATWAALRGRWVIVAGGLLIAALSKEIGLVAVPLIALTVAVWRPNARSTVFALCGLLIAGGAVLGMAAESVIGWLTMTAANGGTGATWTDYLLWQSTALVGLVSRIAVPHGFTIDHDWIAVSRAQQLASWALVLVTVYVGVAVWRTRPMLAWALGWLLLSVLPRFVFRQSDLLHEQHLYLGMAGVSIGLGVLAAHRRAGSFWHDYRAQSRAHRFSHT